ncbi:MAG: sensor histidine kinase [Pseudomonadota bacterium]
MQYFWWFFLLLATALDAKTLHICSDSSYDLAPYVSSFEDTSRELNLSDVLDKSFIPNKQESINFGFTQSAYWFKVEMNRDAHAAHKEWWLSIEYPLLEKIDVYVLSKTGEIVLTDRMGSLLPSSQSKIPLHNYVTQIRLENYPESTLMIRVQTQGSMQVPLTLHSSSGLFSEIEYSSLAIGIFYGIFIVIFLYNIVIYFYTRDSNYLRYLLFLISFILWQMSFDGIGRTYVWEKCRWMIDHGPGFWIAFSSFSALYFGRGFLQTKENIPKLDHILKGMMFLSFAISIVSAFLPYSKTILINASMVILSTFLLLSAGIMMIKYAHRVARFYLSGWSFFLVGTMIFAFNKFELIPNFYGVNHVQQIGAAFEMIFLSWALADRVYWLQSEYIAKINNLNETLSEKVAESLAEVRKKDELIVQQSRLAALGEMIEQIAHQWRQPLNTLSLINQNLYFKRHMGECDDNLYETSHEQFQENLQYMSKTIDDFRNYYKMDKYKEPEDISEVAEIAFRLSSVLLNDAKITGHIESKTTTKVILAKNELIQVFMNLIKNAHDALLERHVNSGEINITIFEVEDFLEIWIEDNAGGIDESIMDQIFTIYFTTKPASQGSGLGLHMCRYIIEESFGGSIRVENTQVGAKFIIQLPSGLIKNYIKGK